MAEWNDLLHDIIIDHFDVKWYEHIKSRFCENQYYDPIANIIRNPTEYVFFDTEIKNEIVFRLDIAFSEYCWDRIEEGIGESDLGYKIDSALRPRYLFSQDIVEVIKYFLPPGDIITSYRLVNSCSNYIGELFDDLKSKSDNIEYRRLLDEIFLKIMARIQAATKETSDLYILTTNHNDELKFNLNQDELAALLEILVRAKIIEVADKKQMSEFLVFSQKHFLSKKSGKKEFSRVNHLSKKMADVRNQVNLKPLQSIIHKINEAYQS